MSETKNSPDNNIVNQAAIATSRRGHRRAAPDGVPIVRALTAIDEAAYHRLLVMPEVKEALFAVESAQAKRDSVSRKLCSGSAAFTNDDLANCERAIADSKAALLKLAEDRPLLKKPPFLSALSVNI